jgi:hypothetical protein
VRKTAISMDRRVGQARIAGVRKALVALVVVVVAVLAGAGVAGGDHAANRVSVAGRLSVRVPAGWHVLRGWLSDVMDPAPRLAMASFPARLSRHTCECGSPNVVNFPRDGASSSSGNTCASRAVSSLGYRPALRASRLRPAGGCARPAMAPTAGSPSGTPAGSLQVGSISVPRPGRRSAPERRQHSTACA